MSTLPLLNTLTYLFTEFQANPFTFDTRNVCLKRPCSGEIQYGEKSQTSFLSVCKPLGYSVLRVLLCSVMAYTRKGSYNANEGEAF